MPHSSPYCWRRKSGGRQPCQPPHSVNRLTNRREQFAPDSDIHTPVSRIQYLQRIARNNPHTRGVLALVWDERAVQICGSRPKSRKLSGDDFCGPHPDPHPHVCVRFVIIDRRSTGGTRAKLVEYENVSTDFVHGVRLNIAFMDSEPRQGREQCVKNRFQNEWVRPLAARKSDARSYLLLRDRETTRGVDKVAANALRDQTGDSIKIEFA